jgi:hypothetical protein
MLTFIQMKDFCVKRASAFAGLKSSLVLFFLLLSGALFSQTISGTIYFDANNNGVVDGVDVFQPSITIELYRDTDNDDVADPGELITSTVSSTTGTYSFSSVSGKSIVKVKTSALGSGTAARNEIIVLSGNSNMSADIYLIGQSPLCYAVADDGDDLIAFNRYDGQVVKIRDLSETAVEALTSNYEATILYALDANDFVKYRYDNGNKLYTKRVGSVRYRNSSGSIVTHNPSDIDGISVAGSNKVWLASLGNPDILFQVDSNGNVIQNLFGSGVDGVRIQLPSAISSCGQLDDLALSPYSGKLYGVYNGCSGSEEYIIEIPYTGANAGVVTNYQAIQLGSTTWTDIEGIGFSSTGEMMGTTGANASPSSQNEHVLFFDEESMQLQAVQQINYASGGDFESCDCITHKSRPFEQIDISGTVYEDNDALTDGVVDGTGINSAGGSTLYAYLADATGKVIRKSNINANGTYTFENLNAYYAYEVVISTSNVSIGSSAPASANLPATVSATGEAFGNNNTAGTGNETGTPNLRINIVAGNSNITGVDFGLREENSISGTVWKDSDNDETIDAGESVRAENVKVYLYSDTNNDGSIDANSSPIDSVLTAADGTYSFGVNYTSGTESYVVLIDSTTLPTGNTLTTAANQTASFNGSGQTDNNNDFGYNLDPAYIKISGTVWKDENEDGNIDAGENERAENIRLRIYEDANTNGSIDGDEPFIYVDATTDANGYYEVNLPYTSAVTYLVEVAENQLEGDLTTNAILSASFSSGGTIVADRDFGYNPNPNVKYISGTVFNDNNQDTLLNAGDLGDEGVDVYLYVDANGNGVLDANENTPVATTTTDKNGYYEFELNNTCQRDTLNIQISENEDDALEKSGGKDDGKVEDDKNELRLNDDGKNFIGIRFRNVTVPNGAEILSSYVQFTARKDGEKSDDIEIHGFDQDNTPVFVDNADYNITNRATTSASVTWSVDHTNWVEDNATVNERTPDLSDIIGEITSRTNWASGNALGFVFDRTNKVKLEAYAHDDGNGDDAAVLYVVYEFNCNDNFIVKIDETDLPSGYVYSTDDIEIAANLVGGGVLDIGNDFGYKFEGALSGNVFHDKSNNNTVDGTGVATANGHPLYVHLVDNNNKVLFKMPVNNDGTYNFDNVPPGNYSVVLSHNEGTIGLNPPAVALPVHWGHTGENVGTGVGNDGTSNGILTGITITTAEVANANLGILKNKTLAIDDENDTWVNTPVSGNVVTNDFDPEGHTQGFGSFLAQDSSSTIASGATLSGFDEAGQAVANAGSLIITANGNYTFTPTSTFVGEVTVPYTICDNGFPTACDTATLVITVKEKLDPTTLGSNSVVANGDDIVSYGEQVSSLATANDADVQGDEFEVTRFWYDNDGNTPTTGGILSSNITIGGLDEEGLPVTNAGTFNLNSNGTYIFTPASGFVGTAVVEYEICDTVSSPYTACDKAFINITVYDDNGSANDPPLAGDDFMITPMNVTKRGSWIGNDTEYNTDDINLNGDNTDIDISTASNNSNSTVISTLATKEGGTVKFYPNGEYEYTPPTDYVGPDQVRYEICDVTIVAPQPLCDSATIYFIVDPIVRDYGDLTNTLYADAWNIFKDEDNNGIPEGATPVWLGTTVSNEEGTVGGGNASADTDADDGLTFPSFLDTTKANTFQVIVNSTVTGTRVWFKLYIDWDQDGTFDSTYVGSGLAQSPTTVDVPVYVPSGEDGDFSARLRVALDSADITPSGGANNGETEDYTGSLTPLPVNLTSFTAKALDATTNILDWTTASELNNEKFIIERRLETEMEFSPVGEVYGAGTTQEMQNYQFVDYNVPQTGSIVYYRLKQIDFDGQFEYSGIVAVTQINELQTVVYPNPTQYTATVTVIGKEAKNTQLQITDLWGSDLTGSVAITNLGGSYQLDVNGLRNGIYIITVIQGNRKHTTRLTVSK